MNDSRKVFSDGTVAGSYRTGFGIDCNGLVTEAAYLAGLRSLLPNDETLLGDGAGTGGLKDTGLAHTIDNPKYVCGGDFIVWTGGGEAHVVYAWETETQTNAQRYYFI